jgi:hypothetical protein
MAQIIRADCDSQFSIEHDRGNNELVLSLALRGLPPIVVERIVSIGETLSEVIIRAVMEKLGGGVIEHDLKKEKVQVH